MQFVGTFAVWILAERLGVSPILTVVVYAMALARTADARRRERAWPPSRSGTSPSTC